MNCFGFVTAALHTHAKNTCVNNKWPLASAPTDSIQLSIIAPPLCLYNDSFTLFLTFLIRHKQVFALCTLVRKFSILCLCKMLSFSLLSSKQDTCTSSTTFSSSHAAQTYRQPRALRSNRFGIVTAARQD